MAKKKAAKNTDADTTTLPAESNGEAVAAPTPKIDEADLNRMMLEAFINGDTPDEIVVQLKKLGIEAKEKRVTKAMAKIAKCFGWIAKKIGE